MSNQSLQCDLVLPQGAHSELAGADPASGWRTIEDLARLAERLDYRGIWAYDRLEPLPRRAPLSVFDGWTTLAALATTTKRLRLGLISSPAPLRDAAQLAKRAACLDVISDGRLTLALDAGYLSEYRVPGRSALSAEAAERGAAETADALRLLWTGQPTSVQGQYVSLDGVFCHPRPRQDRLPLLALGSQEGEASSALDGRALDGSASDGGASDGGASDGGAFDGIIYQDHPDAIGRRVSAAAGHVSVGADHVSAGVGRDGQRRMALLDCRIFDSELDRDRWLASPHVIIFWSDHPDLYVGRNLIGTVEAVRDQMRRFMAAGIREFGIYFRDYPATRSAERFITEVMPELAEPVPAAELARAAAA
jgi:alkanesulfonate monooxygenase SsuD/methylene tetrahydromethanopterin reductase-like flavin-dependent oxidoreductase (luciferase family)